MFASSKAFWAALLLRLAAGLPDGFPVVPISGVSHKVAMPLFGLGTWEYNDSVAEAAVTTAFQMGYRHVDTALVYQNHVGVGRALKKLGIPRSEYFVSTKIPGGLNTTGTIQALEASLTQLGLDYVDLMLIHFPASFEGKGGPDDRKTEWKAIESWAKSGSGKARAIGVSHYCKRHVQDILSINSVPVAVNQVQYHVGMGSASSAANDDKAWFQSHGILYESFSPLCGPCTPPDNKELITGPLVTQIGKAHNKTGAQVALRWLVQQGIPIIPKTAVPKHMKENMDIFDFTLTPAEMAQLSASKKPAVGGGPSAFDSGDCEVNVSVVV